ncbi:hypothetical protein [Bacillus sp. AK031]
MGRYISIFLLTVFIGVIFFLFVIPVVIGIGEFDIVLGSITILFGSFIITQLFYITDILKKSKR